MSIEEIGQMLKYLTAVVASQNERLNKLESVKVKQTGTVKLAPGGFDNSIVSKNCNEEV
jgi:hypothetical protein